DLVVTAPDTVIADAVHVLSSRHLYRLPREQVAALLHPLVSLPGFRIHQRSIVQRALELYGATNLDWGDVMIAAAMERTGSTVVYSYDRDFDRFPGFERREP
ncbi:MAG: PIN domain-containing protein, partial [Vicinamibacterales bacterium]